MSGNLLSKNHPFRASVTHDEAEIVSSTMLTNASPATSDDNSKSTSKITLSPKTKIICFLTVGIITAYGWIQIYDSIYPPKANSVSRNNKESKANKKMSYEEITDLEWGYNQRMFDQSGLHEEKPGWFKQTFCKGVKRSLFCR